ncbi:hypothetical protein GJ744_004808 [Endocarpon pusillum]|uniref:Uncharacterized protein n=1 Tax=Endocarpon pusillum TaxID=364733 RepID=A0A8H7DYP9_9EURO|nr:hypothetical protein GJ744_004808 [Endocarpon pusillum]
MFEATHQTLVTALHLIGHLAGHSPLRRSNLARPPILANSEALLWGQHGGKSAQIRTCVLTQHASYPQESCRPIVSAVPGLHDHMSTLSPGTRPVWAMPTQIKAPKTTRSVSSPGSYPKIKFIGRSIGGWEHWTLFSRRHLVRDFIPFFISHDRLLAFPLQASRPRRSRSSVLIINSIKYLQTASVVPKVGAVCLAGHFW